MFYKQTPYWIRGKLIEVRENRTSNEKGLRTLIVQPVASNSINQLLPERIHIFGKFYKNNDTEFVERKDSLDPNEIYIQPKINNYYVFFVDNAPQFNTQYNTWKTTMFPNCNISHDNELEIYYQTVAPPTTEILSEILKGDMFTRIGRIKAGNIIDLYGETLLSSELKQKPQGFSEDFWKKTSSLIKDNIPLIKEYIILRNCGFDESHIFDAGVGFLNSIINTKQNPYLLFKKINISFDRLDEIAKGLGIKADNKHRVLWGLNTILNNPDKLINFWDETAFHLSGHTLLPLDEISKRVAEYLNLIRRNELITADTVKEILLSNKDLSEQELEKARMNKEIRYRIFDNHIILEAHYINERNIIDYLKDYTQTIDIDPKEINEKITVFEALESKRLNKTFALDESQKTAIRDILQDQLSVLTGGPGTGKTTICKALLFIIGELETIEEFILIAPTGRASTRLSLSVGRSANTMHNYIAKTRKNPISPNAIILIDESSMIDPNILQRIFIKIRHSGVNPRIIFVGDIEQLPPIANGQPFKDIVASGLINVNTLDVIHRQGDENFIVDISHAIKKNTINDTMLFNQNVEKSYVFSEIPAYINQSNEVIESHFKDVYTGAKAHWNLNDTDIQILTPMNKGVLGVKNLNECIGKMVNLHGKDIYHSGYEKLKLNDRVIQTKNDYNRCVPIMNGETGIIRSFNPEQKTISVQFENKKDFEIFSTEGETKDLARAYALTVHKAQGSEYPCVILIIDKKHKFMIDKSLIYTAITRAKDKLVIHADAETLRQGIAKIKAKRITLFNYLIDTSSL